MARNLTIAGGGLAGLACGIGLRQNAVSVCLHEAGSYPRHRVCGEFLCGVPASTLEQLGLQSVLYEAVALTNMAWFHRGRKVLQAPLPLPAWGLSRYRLDAALAERFQAIGGDLCLRSRLTVKPAPGLLDCTGRRPSAGGWLGLKEHFTQLPLEADLEMHLGQRSYVGLSRIENDQVNICGLFPGGTLREGPRGNSLLGVLERVGLGSLSSRLRKAQPVPASAVAVAAFRPGWTARPFPTALGDAAAAIPPFTGNGMSMALESGLLAATALTAYARDAASWEDSQQELRSALQQRFRSRMRLALWLHPFLLNPIGQTLMTLAAAGRVLPLQTLFLSLRGAKLGKNPPGRNFLLA